MGKLGPDVPSWQLEEYEVWFQDPDVVMQNMLDNPDFDGQVNDSVLIWKMLLDWYIQSWCDNRRCNVLPYTPGCRQNDSLSGNWPCRISSSVLFDWGHLQHCLACTLKCHCPHWVSCDPQEYMNALTLMYYVWYLFRWPKIWQWPCILQV